MECEQKSEWQKNEKYWEKMLIQQSGMWHTLWLNKCNGNKLCKYNSKD